jgi:hypothetical protein
VQKGSVPFDLGIARIDGKRMIVGLQGFIEPMDLKEADRPVVEGFNGIGRKLQGEIEPWQRLHVPAQRPEVDADIVADVRLPGIERVRPSIDGQCLLQPSEVDQGAPPQEKRRGVVGLESIA